MEEKRVVFEVSDALIIRQSDLRESVDSLKYTETDESSLDATEREHEECTSVVACRTVCVNGARDAKLVISLSWEADSAW